jgi:aldose sugar dehydrogenase
MKTGKTPIGLSILICMLLTTLKAQSQTAIGNTEIETRNVVTGLDTPWEIIWGPDNHIWITERPGTLSRVDPETEEHTDLLTIADVHEESESGLLGMALHPDFPDTPHVFVVYNYFSGGIKERIVRYTFTGTALDSPFTLIEDIGGSGNHNGSRLWIDENDKLFVTTGDATNTSTAQDMSSLNGKILRMELDGSIPEDNPIQDSYLWSWGHRNPQGLTVAPNGLMYSSEHGPNNDDELNLIEKGRNYGWPNVHGFCNLPSESSFCTENNVKEPLMAWTPTLAVAGIDYYGHDAIPEWKNNILMATLKASELVSIQLGADGRSVTGSQTWFDNVYGRLRDVCVSPGGRVFIATSNRDGRGNPSAEDDRIIEIKAKGATWAQNHWNSLKTALYPNPADQWAYIHLENEVKEAGIWVFDLAGKAIMHRIFSGKSYPLNTSGIMPGHYIVQIQWKEGESRLKMVVER